ncbi:MAG: hypothetical protein ABIR27_06580 [Dokdonella sp.]
MLLPASFNTANEACVRDLVDHDGLTLIEDHGLVGGKLPGSRISLPPFGVLFASRG